MDELGGRKQRSRWRFGDWRFRDKLLVTSLLPVTVVTAVLLLLFLGSLQRVWRNSVPHKVALLQIESLSREYQSEIREYTLQGLDETREEIEEIEEQIPAVLENLEETGRRSGRLGAREIAPLVAAMLDEGERIVAGVEPIRDGGADESTFDDSEEEALEAFEEREEALETLIGTQLAAADAELERAFGRFGWMLAGSAVLGVGFGLFLALGLARRIQQPLAVLGEASERILDGDFRARDRVRTHDELGELASGFDRGAEEIRRLLAEARDNLDNLKQHQAQLLQSGKLAAVGELAAGVAHELNNPLSAVLTYSVLVREKVEKNPEDLDVAQLRERLNLVETAARRCKDIADKLLTFSRQDSDEMGPVSLAEVVDEALALLRSMLKRWGIELETEIDPRAPTIWGNSGQLQQVLINLVGNAAQAMTEGGCLRIAVGRAGDHGELVVEDEGPGIDPAVRDRIFEPFVTTKPPGQGTGLGLSIVYGIVQGHDGEIRVDSEVGVGTTFAVTFPPGPAGEQGAA